MPRKKHEREVMPYVIAQKQHLLRVTGTVFKLPHTCKGRSALTAEEYRVDCLMLLEYIKRMRGVPQSVLAGGDFSDVNAEFFRSVSAADLYAFTYCGEVRKVTAAPS
jgi:hypothetical protein